MSFLMGGSSNSQKAAVISRQTEDAVARRCLDELVAAIDMEPTQIVVFSSNNSLLRAAREVSVRRRRCRRCRGRGRGRGRSRGCYGRQQPASTHQSIASASLLPPHSIPRARTPCSAHAVPWPSTLRMSGAWMRQRMRSSAVSQSSGGASNRSTESRTAKDNRGLVWVWRRGRRTRRPRRLESAGKLLCRY